MSLNDSIESRRFGFSIRDPRAVALLHPFQFALSLSLFAIAVVFTIFPAALEHSPVAFEKRGIIHHAFHYALLVGAAASLYGLFSTSRRRLRVELLGLVLLFAAIALNLVALVAEGIENPAVDLSGFTVAIRTALLLGLAIRVYTLAVQPAISLPTTTAK